MNHNDLSSANRAAEVVLKYMLAPTGMAEEPGAIGPLTLERNQKGEQTLYIGLRWDLGHRAVWRGPKEFCEDLVKFLAPISEAITYGEVVSLRSDLKNLRESTSSEIERLAKENVELRRYRDAYMLSRGVSL